MHIHAGLRDIVVTLRQPHNKVGGRRVRSVNFEATRANSAIGAATAVHLYATRLNPGTFSRKLHVLASTYATYALIARMSGYQGITAVPQLQPRNAKTFSVPG